MPVLILAVVALVLGAGLVAAIAGLDRYTGNKLPKKTTSSGRGTVVRYPEGAGLNEPVPDQLTPTDEVFVDPVTRETIRVYLDVATGRRVYQKVDGSSEHETRPSA